LKENIRKKNKKFIQKFEHKNQKLNRESTGRLEVETSKLYANIKLVKDSTDKEFSGVKDRFDCLVCQVNENCAGYR
jgi:hypothetical protein